MPQHRRVLALALSVGAAATAAAQAPSPAPAEGANAVQDPQPGPNGRRPNRLSQQASAYLRQHQYDPVDWYPWGAEALAKAKQEQKPIFLSIGYAACHWCHVMAHESFQDAAVAAVMNRDFVCIKVDREERPDLDEIYLSAVQAMGEDGGWPLSVWLAPDGKPFYGGTYFPPQDRHGRPGFRRVLEHLAAAWRDRRPELERGADELAAHLAKVLAPALPAGEPAAQVLATAVAQAEQRFDAEHGGFAGPPRHAPKFPHASELQVLLRRPEPAARRMAATTLAAMRNGGMFDQLGHGFHRYSTDRRWVVPHFEKMLYDNALLATTYLDASLALDEPDHAATAVATLEYLLRELRHPRGGFWSSQDADSEGEEGRFFVWSAAEFDRVLGEQAAFGRRAFGVTDQGNHEGANVLVRAAAAAALAEATREPRDAVERRLAAVREALLAARAQRVRPGTDDKILCGWNGLAITAFARGHRVLGEARWLDAARATAAFVLDELVDGGRCRRSWRDGAHHAGCLDDHGMLADGLLELFEVDPDPRWLDGAKALLAAANEHFGAPDGGYYFTADDHEALLVRSRSATESSTPSGLATVVRASLRAGLLLGDEALYERGLAALRANHKVLTEAPSAVPALVQALQFHVDGPREVVVAGAPDDPRTQALLRRAWRAFPQPLVVAHVHDGNREALAARSPVFVGKVPVDGVPAAYVCRRGVCERPVTDPAALEFGQ